MALSKIPPSGQTQYAGVRNLIINVAVQVAQRGDTTSVTAGYGGADRFRFFRSGAAVVSLEQDTDVPSNQGFSNSQKVDVTTADSSLAAGDYAMITHRIEGQNLQHLLYGTSGAKKLTLQFWVRSPKTGTHIVELYHGDAFYFNNQTYTIASADTWQKVTVTFDGYQTTALDNDTGIGIQIAWWLAAGSTYSGGTLSSNTWHNTAANRAVGQVNVVDSTSNNFYLTGVQLEVGDKATDFEHRSFDDELDRCKRYYQKSFAYGTAPANDIFGVRHAISKGGDSTVYGGARVDLEKSMRATPTAVAYNPQAAPANSGAYLNDIQNGSTTTQYAITSINGYTDHLHFYVGGFNQGANDYGCNWTADAEL